MLKVGDKVRVKSEEEVSKHQTVFDLMQKYCGQYGEVDDLAYDNYVRVRFKDRNMWAYALDSLEIAEESAEKSELEQLREIVIALSTEMKELKDKLYSTGVIY